MRRILFASLLPIVSAVPLTAQFDGVITMKMGDADHQMDVKYFVSGQRAAFTMLAPANSGPISGKEIRGVIDFSTMKETVLIPMQMGGMNGMKMVVDLNKAAGDNDKTSTYSMKDLGTTETIAGLTCEDFEIDNNGKLEDRACMNKQSGHFAMSMVGGNARGTAWMRAFGQNVEAFPLKVTDSDGKPMMLVTSVQKGGVPSDIFTIPDGYMEMPSMGGRGRGGE
ncbi:MAG: DUF4412 domain-containing protein [Gemmatimonadales bacterium]